MSTKYILNGHTPVVCNDLMEWAAAFEDSKSRIVAQDQLDNGVFISTVFLGLDHSFDGGKPILFETMVTGGNRDDKKVRYSTWEEAEAGHAAELANEKRTR